MEYNFTLYTSADGDSYTGQAFTLKDGETKHLKSPAALPTM
jgi:hypothetical protein